METLLIQTENSEQLRLIEDFLKEHRLKSRVLSDDDKEDIVLGRLMEETDYSETVDTTEFLKQLRK
ncbi:MAG: hypothetical protein KF781_00480 [Chitinophagaceae bacterium]|nr:hypothetical protein [Chitinophagaceae bacterium]MCW5905210.1 hypothetical protein [Chitinophagaceae bacterium]